MLEDSLLVAVIVALPMETALTTPSDDTVTISLSLVDHIISLLVAFSGIISATSFTSSPIPKDMLVCSI